VATPEPERDMVKRILPLAVPALAVAVGLGAILGGRGAAASAGIGAALVFANFAAYAYSLSAAARISLVVLFAVGLGGFVVRLALFVLIVVGLRQLDWFSTVAFVSAFVPATVVLLALEIKLLGGRMQADLWTIPAGPGSVWR
jgi:hypothetical protein